MIDFFGRAAGGSSSTWTLSFSTERKEERLELSESGKRLERSEAVNLLEQLERLKSELSPQA